MIESRFDPNDPHRWRVKIQRGPWGASIDFYVYRFMPPNYEVLTVKDSQHVVMRLEAHSPLPQEPTFRFDGMEGQAMMAALAEALEEDGVKTPNDFKIQGLLKATTYHLEDLRHLLKLPKEQK